MASNSSIQRPAQPPPWSVAKSAADWLLPPPARVAVDIGLLVLLAATAAVVATRPDGAPRVTLTLVSASVVPGYCLCRWLPLRALDALIGLSIALSLGLEAALCLALLWLHRWQPIPMAAAIGAVCSIVLVADLLLIHRQVRRGVGQATP
jgi:hypothetical protein